MTTTTPKTMTITMTIPKTMTITITITMTTTIPKTMTITIIKEKRSPISGWPYAVQLQPVCFCR